MHRRYIDLLPGKENLVGRLEHLLVRIGGESLVTNVGANIHWKFVGPQRQNMCSAAAINQLLWSFTDVVHQLVP